MKKKIDILREHIAAGDWEKALQLAAKWPNSGARIKKAWAAISNRQFYVQLGCDIEKVSNEGKQSLLDKFGIKG